MKIFLLTITILLVSACSTFSNQYSCGTIPEAECKSVSEVYEDTNGNVYDYRKDLNGNKTKISDNNNTEITITESNKAIDYVVSGDPILTKPIIMRVLYSSHQNEQNDLDIGGYVYLRMRDSEWVLEK